MRRLNAIITILIIILFITHLVCGGLELAGMTSGGSRTFTAITYLMLSLIVIHAAISVKFTIDTLMSCRRAGVSYIRENRIFWLRRVSGIALILFITCHVVIFTGSSANGAYRLKLFDMAELLTQLLMVASLLLHLVTNIAPLRISLGLRDQGNVRTDIMLVLAILLLFAGIAFVIYFIRWSTF